MDILNFNVKLVKCIDFPPAFSANSLQFNAILQTNFRFNANLDQTLARSIQGIKVLTSKQKLKCLSSTYCTFSSVASTLPMSIVFTFCSKHKLQSILLPFQPDRFRIKKKTKQFVSNPFTLKHQNKQHSMNAPRIWSNG